MMMKEEDIRNMPSYEKMCNLSAELVKLNEEENAMYYIISNSYGDTRVRAITKKELEERINDADEGPIEYLDKIEKSDTNYWGDGVLIIKGEIIVPKAVETVTKMEVD